MEKKIMRVGVMGTLRGATYAGLFKNLEGSILTAVCDFNPRSLENVKGILDDSIAVFDNFDDFIESGLFDAVVLCNYFCEHVPFAIRAMKAGKHVYSEVLPVQTMKEAVELIEAVEETGLVYAYAENYCYMSHTFEMWQRYKAG